MDSNKGSTQVKRLAVVDTGRRRRWTHDEKLKIVLESLQAPRAISSRARRHGISRSLLLIWRRSFEADTGSASRPKPAFVPAMVMGASQLAIAPAA
jgi:transposase